MAVEAEINHFILGHTKQIRNIYSEQIRKFYRKNSYLFANENVIHPVKHNLLEFCTI